MRVTFPGDQVLTNADYAVLGLEPFVSDDFQTEGSSGSANRAGRPRTASTARKPRGRPQARRAAPGEQGRTFVGVLVLTQFFFLP